MIERNNSDNSTQNGSEILIEMPRAYEIILILYLFIAAVLATFGNGIILTVEAKNKFKTSTDWLVVFLAGNDISCSWITIPFYIIFHMGYWPSIGSDFTCKLHYYVEQTTMFSSVVLLCVVALDRYFKTCRPHRKFLTPVRTLRVCICETVIACLLMSPAMFIINYKDTEFCSHTELAGGVFIVLFPVVFILSFILMIIIICICYVKIALKIKNKLALKKKSRTTVPKQGTQVTSQMTSFDWAVPTQSTSKSVLFKRNNKILPCSKVPPHSVVSLKLYPGIEELPVSAEKLRTQQDVHTIVDINAELSAEEETKLSRACVGPDTNGRDNDKMGVLQSRTKEKGTVDGFESRLNRTTKIMFAISMVFLFSWLPTLATFLIRRLVDYQTTIGGQVFVMFARKSFIINTFMNPIFYIWMSSSFKDRAGKVIESTFACSK